MAKWRDKGLRSETSGFEDRRVAKKRDERPRREMSCYEER